MKKKLFVILITTALFTCGCGTTQIPEQETTEQNLPDAYEDALWENPDFVEEESETIEQDFSITGTNTGMSYGAVPEMYMQDYPDVAFPNGKTVDTSGNLVMCLCMLKSYYSQSLVEPPEFIADHGDYFTDGAPKNIEELNLLLSESIGPYANIDMTNFDYEELAKRIYEDGAVALIRINNPSIYGESMTYLIVTGVSAEGYLEVRDPNKENMSSVLVYSKWGNFPCYPAAEVIYAAGQDAEMYFFY